MEFDYPWISILLFFIFWFGVTFIISKISGWSTLSQKFPDADGGGAVISRRFFVSIRMRLFGNYRTSIFFEVLPQGLRMKVFFPLKFGHNNILIPWNELKVVKEMTSLFGMYKFSFESLPEIYFTTFRGTGKWIVEQKKQYAQ